MGFGPQNGSLVCEYCGFEDELEIESVPDEQVIDLVLPTSKGHRWAEAAHLLACQKCGAHTILPAGEKTISCPYCGSNQIIESEETQELIDPQFIGLMAVEEEQIPELVRKWLKQGMYTPDDLSQAIKHLEFRQAYYPFWLFSGSLEAQWSCEVREGNSQTARWAPRSGTEVLLFDDLIVPGITGIPANIMKDLNPFRLDRLEAFVPDHLAGWPALAYDRSMADASLLAREAFVNEARSILSRRVEAGSERREFRVGGGKWSGMTFKLTFLPLWVGVYRYKGAEYRVIVNGQTGKVAGEKPQDEVKKAMLWAAGLGTIVVIGLIAAMVLLLLSRIRPQFGQSSRSEPDERNDDSLPLPGSGAAQIRAAPLFISDEIEKDHSRLR
jgi:DNA-directed RNA polymerase subunit RPC12/RpoP